MITFPNAKINLGLNILGRRPDSYHELRMIMLPVGLCDALEILPACDGENHFSISGRLPEGKPGENLCEKARDLFNREFPIPPVSIHLYKKIPSGAGLGGGSADAAFTLRMLQQLFHPALPEQQMMSMAAQLGSDCPFFLINEPCLASGRGTELEPVGLDLGGLHLVLVKPEESVSTAWAYGQLSAYRVSESPLESMLRPSAQWKDWLKNDFEEVIFPAHPGFAAIKDKLYQLGAVYASMSGSGSALYGLFPKAVNVPEGFFGAEVVWSGPLNRPYLGARIRR